jgi:hypothetical protein
MEAEDFRRGDCGQGCGQCCSLKTAVDGVARLGVAALKVEQVTRFKAYAGADQTDARRGQGWKPFGQRRHQRGL